MNCVALVNARAAMGRGSARGANHDAAIESPVTLPVRSRAPRSLLRTCLEGKQSRTKQVEVSSSRLYWWFPKHTNIQAGHRAHQAENLRAEGVRTETPAYCCIIAQYAQGAQYICIAVGHRLVGRRLLSPSWLPGRQLLSAATRVPSPRASAFQTLPALGPSAA